MNIEYVKERRKKNFTTEVYTDYYGHYIPKNKECLVYEYKGKAYPQDFYYIEEEEEKKYIPKSEEKDLKHVSYYLGKNYTTLEDMFEFTNEEIPNLNDEEFKLALLEREGIPPKSSNEHILMPAIMISNNEKQAYVILEIKIESFKSYDFEELNFYKDLCRFARNHAGEYFDGKCEEYVLAIKELVKDKCQPFVNGEDKFKVKEVLVAIRDVDVTTK